MTTEQLTMILDAAASAGDGAMWLAILWIGKMYLSTLATTAGFTLVAYWAYRISVRLINDHSFGEAIIEKMQGHCRRGALYQRSGIDRRAVLEKIDFWIELEKATIEMQEARKND